MFFNNLYIVWLLLFLDLATKINNHFVNYYLLSSSGVYLENSIEYRRDIDILRAISIILVVLFHSFESLFSSGFLGVDVFFVISGFLITKILIKNYQIKDPKEYFSKFWKARVRRLFPSLLFMVSIIFVISTVFLFDSELQSLSLHGIASLLYWQNFNLVSEIGYFDSEAIRKPFLHLWSLSVEEHFYIFWPVILFCFMSLGKTNFFIKIFLISVFIASFSLSLYQYHYNPQSGFYNSVTRFWELSIGSFIAITGVQSINKINYGYILFFALVCMLIVPSNFIHQNFHQFLVCTLTAGVIYFGFKTNGLKIARLGYVGKISYPLYLWHWPIFSLGFLLFGINHSQPFGMLALICLAILLATVSYEYIEKIRYASRGFSICLIWLGILLPVLILAKSGYLNSVRPFTAYMDNQALELKRTPAKDKQCEGFAKKIVGNVNFNYCRTNYIGSNKTIALIGDSHAHSLYPGFSKIAENNGYNTLLLANSSCPPLLGFNWHNKQRSIEVCQNSIHQILDVINSTSEIEKVVMTTRGPTYIHGDVSGKFTTKAVKKSLITFKNKDFYNYEVFEQALQKSFENIKVPLKGKFYILENPELDFSPEDALPRPLVPYLTRTVSRQLYDLRMLYYNQAVKRASNSNFTVLDPRGLLCNDDSCEYFSGKFLYADDDHFSVYGSGLVADFFQKDIFAKSK